MSKTDSNIPRYRFGVDPELVAAMRRERLRHGVRLADLWQAAALAETICKAIKPGEPVIPDPTATPGRPSGIDARHILAAKLRRLALTFDDEL